MKMDHFKSERRNVQAPKSRNEKQMKTATAQIGKDKQSLSLSCFKKKCMYKRRKTIKTSSLAHYHLHQLLGRKNEQIEVIENKTNKQTRLSDRL